MSQSSSQEKTEQPTPKRLRESREKGEIARSRELSSLVVMGSGVAALMLLGAGVAAAALDWMRRALSPDLAVLEAPLDLARYVGGVTGDAFNQVMPLLMVGFLAALLGPMMLGGWNLSAQALQPKFSRLNPLEGVKRLFSKQALMELVKAVLKAGLLGAIGGVFIWLNLDELLALARQPLAAGIGDGLGLLLACLLWVTAGLALIALIDAPFQRWSHTQKLRMTKDEVRREMKESEGSPEVKGRQRQLQHQLSQRRMMEAVPTADVVITNPTHYAVALKYDAGTMRAPKVVARGRDLVALSIRELARRHQVQVLEAPPLARALYRQSQLDAEIPAGLYLAVAQVLSYLHQLRQWKAQTRRPGTRPAQVPKAPSFNDLPGGEPDDLTE